MLPAADSAQQAEVLMQIAAAHPVGRRAGTPEPARRQRVSGRCATRRPGGTSTPSGDVEALADIRIDRLRKDSLGRDGLTSAHVQQVWRINTAQGARSFASHSVMYAAMSETLCIVRARVLKRDGSELAATVSADQPVRGAGLVDVLRLALARSALSAAAARRPGRDRLPPAARRRRSIPGRATTRAWICSATAFRPGCGGAC